MSTTKLFAMSAPFEIRAAEGDGGAKLPSFEMTAYTGGAMDPGGFGGNVVVNLKGLKITSQKLPIRFNHDVEQGVGHTTDIEVEGGKLVARGVISRSTEAAREVVQASKNGFPWQASIGASVTRSTYVGEGKTAEVNGRTFDGPVTVIDAAVLREISVVEMGADDKTKTSIAAQVGGDNEGSITMGNETATGGDTAGRAAGAVEGTAGSDVDSMIEAARAEAKRILDESKREAGIRAEASRIASENFGTQKAVDLLANAMIESGSSVEEFKKDATAMVEATMPGVGAPRRDSGLSGMTEDVLAAAACEAAGLDRLSDEFDDKTLSAAQSSFGGSLGLKDLTNLVARYNGHNVGLTSGINEGILRAASPRSFRGGHIEAAAGTMSVPTILSNVAGKFLGRGFDSVENSWRQIASTRPVRDFKQITTVAPNASFTFEEVGPNGELPSGTVGERVHTNRAKTRGKLFGISREDFINDDLGAFARMVRMLGRGGALALNNIFWAELQDDAAFFSAGNNNLITGASSALSITSLASAVTVFKDQKDDSGESDGSDGNPIGITPRILLVPNALEFVAAQIVGSRELRDPGAKAGTINPHAGQYRPVVSSYLTSTTAWHLLAGPDDMPVIEVVFLNGRQRPTIETADARFDTLGIDMRGYFDFGVAKQEHRAGVKSTGAA